MGECELGCTNDRSCGLDDDDVCAINHPRQLERNGLDLQKAYCNNIEDAGDEYACYNRAKAELRLCAEQLDLEEGDSCSIVRDSCVDADSLRCVRFIDERYRDGTYKCTERECVYTTLGICRRTRGLGWIWRNVPLVRYAEDESKCR